VVNISNTNQTPSLVTFTRDNILSWNFNKRIRCSVRSQRARANMRLWNSLCRPHVSLCMHTASQILLNEFLWDLVVIASLKLVDTLVLVWSKQTEGRRFYLLVYNSVQSVESQLTKEHQILKEQETFLGICVCIRISINILNVGT
jgi:hypothetical protein